MVPEEVSLDKEVLGPIGNALLGYKQQGAIVVLKDSEADGWLEKNQYYFTYYCCGVLILDTRPIQHNARLNI